MDTITLGSMPQSILPLVCVELTSGAQKAANPSRPSSWSRNHAIALAPSGEVQPNEWI